LNNGHASRAQSVCSGKNQNHSQADDSDIFGYVLASNYHLALITLKTTSYPLQGKERHASLRCRMDRCLVPSNEKFISAP
jgi:hypothetical protein